MLLVDFSQFNFFINLLILTLLIYILFLKSNNYKNIKYNDNNLTKIKNVKQQPLVFYIRIGICLFLALFTHLNLYRGFTRLVFWDNILLSNTNLFIYSVVAAFALFLVIILNLILKFDNELRGDFFFAFFNIAIWTPCIFLSNNVLILIVFLEFNSAILFFLLITSKILYTRGTAKNKNSLFYKNKNYINVVFFNYWSTFFASVLLIYVYIHFYFLYGSTNFNFVNNSLIYNSNHTGNFGVFIFIFALFLKMGLTPLHLFKLEIYKNISYIYIFLYSSFFFFYL